MRLVSTIAGLVVSVALSAAAHASALVHFDVSGPTPSSYFNFDVAAMPTPTASTTTSFTIDNVTTKAFNTAIGFYTFQADYTFYLADPLAGTYGGLSSAQRGRIEGDQLFSGLPAMPKFTPGNFNGYLSFGVNGFAPYTIAITPISTPAPEPATWALLVAGIGVVGIALRRSRGLVGDPVSGARTA